VCERERERERKGERGRERERDTNTHTHTDSRPKPLEQLLLAQVKSFFIILKRLVIDQTAAHNLATFRVTCEANDTGPGSVCIYVRVNACMHVCMYVACMYIFMYVSMDVYMLVHAYEVLKKKSALTRAFQWCITAHFRRHEIPESGIGIPESESKALQVCFQYRETKEIW